MPVSEPRQRPTASTPVLPPEDQPRPEPEAQPLPPRISIVIVSLNRAPLLRRSLEMLAGQHNVIVVDNGSTDGAADVGGDFPDVKWMRLPKNFGLTKALNIGLRAAEGEFILCLHDDARISADAVTKLADYLETHPETGMVCPLLVDESGNRAPQTGALPSPANPDPYLAPVTGSEDVSTPCVSGAAFMFRAFFLRAMRQVDERYGNYGSHLELCAQMRRASRKIVVLQSVTAIHEKTASTVARAALEADRVAGTASFLGKHCGFVSGLIYRLKTGLGGLVTFRFPAVSGAFSGQKIDGSTQT